jgi:hypothetical protein
MRRVPFGFFTKWIIRDDLFPLFLGANKKVGMKIVTLRGLRFQEDLEFGPGLRPAPKNQVARLEQRSDVDETELGQQIAQFGHPDWVPAADIDCTQKSKVNWHQRGLFFAICY